MAENEFPVASSNNDPNAGSNLPSTQTDSAKGNANNSNDTYDNDIIANERSSDEDNSSSSNGMKFTDFIARGDILRKIFIAFFLILFIAGAIFGLVSLQSATTDVTYRKLGEYSSDKIGPVLDFLDLEGFSYNLRGGNTIMVDVNEYAKISELMLRRGIALPEKPADDGNAIIMSDTGFGVSQRLEGERIKHGREIQLARAIERIDGVEHATVLLAIPKENVFARVQNRPSAAVVVTLKTGAYLTPDSVNSIRYMVSSSVHNLLAKDVSVTDQTGRLLSLDNKSNSAEDRLQKEFEMRTLREAQYRDKIDAILTPMLGFGNYAAEVDVTLDTTVEEETRQMYDPDNNAVRSETLREQKGNEEKKNPYGVPGSLSNQPPANAVIPQQLKDGTGMASESNSNQKESREAVRNYEVDTTIRHTRRPTNVVSRLTVSVAVDYVRQKDAEGMITYVPRSADELEKIATLIKGGLGLNESRGDFVRVETLSFPHADPPPPLPWWQQDQILRLAKIGGAVLVIIVIVIFVIRPMVNKLLNGKTEEDSALDYNDLDAEPALIGNDDLNLVAANKELSDQIYSINKGGGIELPNLNKDQDLLKAVRTLVSNEPQLSSEVVREWINADIEKEKKKEA